MNICTQHWTALRAAIDLRGIGQRVSKNGAVAADRLTSAVSGLDDATSFDPLLNANFAIWRAYMEDVGLAALSLDGCPLCEVEKSRGGLAQNWIEGAAEDQITLARHLGIGPAPAA